VFFQEGWRAGLRWLVSNRFLLIGIGTELILINILIYVPPFQALFEEGPVPPVWWLLLIWYAPALFLLEEGRKAIVRWQDSPRRKSGAVSSRKVERQQEL
jgi:hypothetical protein